MLPNSYQPKSFQILVSQLTRRTRAPVGKAGGKFSPIQGAKGNPAPRFWKGRFTFYFRALHTRQNEFPGTRNQRLLTSKESRADLSLCILTSLLSLARIFCDGLLQRLACKDAAAAPRNVAFTGLPLPPRKRGAMSASTNVGCKGSCTSTEATSAAPLQTPLYPVRTKHHTELVVSSDLLSKPVICA